MSCAVCSAPPLPLNGACVFCRSPLADGPDPAGLLDYLAARIPQLRSRRGILRRGAVRDLRIEVAGTVYRGRVRRDAVELEPELEPARWVEGLLLGLSRRAAGEPELRSAMSRSGWALR